MNDIVDKDLPLQRIYHWEKQRSNEVYLTQPLGGDRVRDFTWGEALVEARKMAAYIDSFGWEKGQRIAILGKNSAWWFIAEYAIWMSGNVSVPIYSSTNGKDLEYILEHSESKAIFIGQLEPDDWSDLRLNIPNSLEIIHWPHSNLGEIPGSQKVEWEDIIKKSHAISGNPLRKAEDLAVIIYTSGTTGTPKGVMHSFGAMAVAINALLEVYGCGCDDRLVSYLPLAHVADRLSSQATSIGAGCRVFFMEDISTFTADMQRARPTFFLSVPRLWTKFRQAVLAEIPSDKLTSMLSDPAQVQAARKSILQNLGLDACRLAVVGAAPLPPELRRWYQDLGLELYEVYGMTENFAISHVSLPGQTKPGCVGKPMPGVEAKTSDSGELLTRGASTMLGYYKDLDKTNAAFSSDGYLHTGDVGQIDKDGYFKITGRSKEIFKTSKGKYIAPSPIENLLSAHNKIEACCVTGSGLEHAFAIIMLAQGLSDAENQKEITESLNDHLSDINQQLAAHEKIKFVVIVKDQWTVDDGFITPTFKIKREVIEQYYNKKFNDWINCNKSVVWE